jgi:hypothetical protein
LAAAMPVRDWNPRESRLIGEWVLKTYPGCRVVFRARLGPETASPLYVAAARYADAVVFCPAWVSIIEAKLDSELGAVAQLKLYKKLFQQTPEYMDYWTVPIHLILLVARLRPDVVSYAASEGIEVVQYFPAWVQDYFTERVIKYRRNLSGLEGS